MTKAGSGGRGIAHADRPERDDARAGLRGEEPDPGAGQLRSRGSPPYFMPAPRNSSLPLRMIVGGTATASVEATEITGL
jgi:hypothetical protein